NAPEILTDAVSQVLGGVWAIRCEVAGEGTGSRAAAPPPRQPDARPAGEPPTSGRQSGGQQTSGRQTSGRQSRERQPAGRPPVERGAGVAAAHRDAGGGEDRMTVAYRDRRPVNL